MLTNCFRTVFVQLCQRHIGASTICFFVVMRLKGCLVDSRTRLTTQSRRCQRSKNARCRHGTGSRTPEVCDISETLTFTFAPISCNPWCNVDAGYHCGKMVGDRPSETSASSATASLLEVHDESTSPDVTTLPTVDIVIVRRHDVPRHRHAYDEGSHDVQRLARRLFPNLHEARSWYSCESVRRRRSCQGTRCSQKLVKGMTTEPTASVTPTKI